MSDEIVGLSQNDMEMIKSRQIRARNSSLNPIIRIKTKPAKDKKSIKEIQFELMDEVIVFESKDFESSHKMFNAILIFLNSIKVY